MLNMGFVDDVEKILNAGGKETTAACQTLLFSATLPVWVKDITKRFLRPGFVTVDLVGTEKMKVCARLVCVCIWGVGGRGGGRGVRGAEGRGGSSEVWEGRKQHAVKGRCITLLALRPPPDPA